MKRVRALSALIVAPALMLAACGETADEEPTTEAQTSEEATTAEQTDDHADAHGEHDMHDHPADGGAPPEGIQEAEDPTYPVGTEVVLLADHMPGMENATATISGAFTTTTYSVSYVPTDGGDPITDHRWVVHEELDNPTENPVPDGAEVVLNAEHMSGMDGATATIDYSTQETVYMVDIETDEMTMTNHKWVTESEIQPTE